MCKTLQLFLLFGIALAWTEVPALGCPLCQAGVASEEAASHDEDGAAYVGNTALGYNLSVLFMMSMPFLIMAGFVTACYRACCKHRRLSESAVGHSSSSRVEEMIEAQPQAASIAVE